MKTDREVFTKMKYLATTLKVLRVIRPLRLMRAPEMRNTIESLIKSIPQLFNALLLNVIILYVFSILGVQLFCGRFSYCEGATTLDKKECLQSKRIWETHP